MAKALTLSIIITFTCYYNVNQSSSFAAAALSDAATLEDKTDIELEALIDNLNKVYTNGKPSNDYNEAGIVVHTIDGFCNPYADSTIGNKCNYNLADSSKTQFFGGTVTNPNRIAASLINEMISSPKLSDNIYDEIGIFPSWNPDGTDDAYGPAAGIVYYPCAVKQVCIVSIKLLFVL